MIKVTILNDQAFIWNANDASKVRKEYRIVGCMVGSLPRAPMQNVQLGLPLQLLPEEATLLFEKGYAVPVKDNIDEQPTEEQVKLYENYKAQQYEKQVEICKIERKEEILQNKEKIMEGKKKKRDKILMQRKLAGEDVDDTEFAKEVEFNIADIKIDPIPKSSMLVETFIQDPWQVEVEPAEWNYPSTSEETHRYLIYKDLWEKGNYITNGSKFGGDYLVYPGDPHLFHSFYIAVYMPFKERFSALDLISKGRLGANVKKTVVLCTVENEIVKYTSVQWTGMR